MLLAASHVEADVLFTPDSFTFTVTPIFNDTGTNTICWGCADADRFNNVQAELKTVI